MRWVVPKILAIESMVTHTHTLTHTDMRYHAWLYKPIVTWAKMAEILHLYTFYQFWIGDNCIFYTKLDNSCDLLVVPSSSVVHFKIIFNIVNPRKIAKAVCPVPEVKNSSAFKVVGIPSS